MSANDLKKHTVKVGSGSGCVFQPMDDESTYILTAKHLFQLKNEETNEQEYIEDGTHVSITFLEFDGNSWNSTVDTFTMGFEENFFPHPEADAAILKIPYRQGYDNIHLRKNRVQSDFHLCGFPGNLRNQPTVSAQYDSEEIRDFLQSDDYFEIAQLENPILNYSEIEGYSGGGIMTFDDSSNVFVIGIQSRMAKEKLNLDFGKIGFVSIRYFEEIIETYKTEGKLLELLPLFLKSFGFLSEGIFNMNSGPLEKDREEFLATLLVSKAGEVANSNLTPKAIRDFIDEKLLLMSHQDGWHLKRKKIWALWFELLIILSVIKRREHSLDDFKNIFKKFRFFYSDINTDFFGRHLQDLYKADFNGLETNGLVVVASNVKAQGSLRGVFKFDKIPINIKEFRNDFIRQKALDGIFINMASSFPYDKYRFTNISTFKEEMIDVLDSEFFELPIENCLPILTTEYERLIS
ncbi:ABC-three component system protein [Leeuwenhoekiella sp.]|uniref:ABC-three component system protein n=1 Tax=Leeuwenhoekiella sp. TaxID=1977054 RepID=UPI000C611F40|nr:ABC-three component system protein [Leeuwenhoekiella sp.]MBA82687.1 hypothetical protein [Leeuwenhoekiella sp.]|tara:strand:- start:106866 stop:108257 length:1392 start_codon:yes stop_codon:yes gene_type:complete